MSRLPQPVGQATAAREAAAGAVGIAACAGTAAAPSVAVMTAAVTQMVLVRAMVSP
ncbi:hypothetical protein L1856_10015 [Streptomyces sp. Tue 6430]|nr:hypothetical protein [Streptomyces sp. Tue 6430]